MIVSDIEDTKVNVDKGCNHKKKSKKSCFFFQKFISIGLISSHHYVPVVTDKLQR